MSNKFRPELKAQLSLINSVFQNPGFEIQTQPFVNSPDLSSFHSSPPLISLKNRNQMSVSSSPPAAAEARPGLHQDDADEEDENVKQLKECSVLYLALQECLVNSNRDWKACQPAVQALKECHAKRSQLKK